MLCAWCDDFFSCTATVYRYSLNRIAWRGAAADPFICSGGLPGTLEQKEITAEWLGEFDDACACCIYGDGLPFNQGVGGMGKLYHVGQGS